MARSITKKNTCARGRQTPSSGKKSHSNTYLGHRNYSLYINRVLKEVVPERGISSCSFDIMNILINNIFDRIATQTSSLMCFRNRCTLTPEDIQKAVDLLLPGKLAKYAVTFGSEAVQRHVNS